MDKILQHNDYVETFKRLKERVLTAQYRSYSAVNSEMILAYLDIGKTISEKTKTGWGTSVIKLLGLWERLNNPNFKQVEFDLFRNEIHTNYSTLRNQLKTIFLIKY